MAVPGPGDGECGNAFGSWRGAWERTACHRPRQRDRGRRLAPRCTAAPRAPRLADAPAPGPPHPGVSVPRPVSRNPDVAAAVGRPEVLVVMGSWRADAARDLAPKPPRAPRIARRREDRRRRRRDPGDSSVVGGCGRGPRRHRGQREADHREPSGPSADRQRHRSPISCFESISDPCTSQRPGQPRTSVSISAPRDVKVPMAAAASASVSPKIRRRTDGRVTTAARP